jgi:hypothetical protein
MECATCTEQPLYQQRKRIDQLTHPPDHCQLIALTAANFCIDCNCLLRTTTMDPNFITAYSSFCVERIMAGTSSSNGGSGIRELDSDEQLSTGSNQSVRNLYSHHIISPTDCCYSLNKIQVQLLHMAPQHHGVLTFQLRWPPQHLLCRLHLLEPGLCSHSSQHRRLEFTLLNHCPVGSLPGYTLHRRTLQ